MSLDLSHIAADPERMPILRVAPNGNRWVGFKGGGGIVTNEDYEMMLGMYAIVNPRNFYGKFLDGRVVLIEKIVVLS